MLKVIELFAGVGGFRLGLEANNTKSNQKFNLSIKDKKLKTSSSIKGDFFVDYSKKPIALSFRNIPNMSYPLHTIIKFKGRNLIILTEFSTREKFRPMIFKSENSIKIKRLINQ